MAQDILITPSSGEPQILFRGSGTTDTAVELNVMSSYQSATGSGTALLFEGEEGLLFGITDNLSSGTIFSVADITGLPSIEVNSDGQVKLCEYGSGILVYNDIIGDDSLIHISGVNVGASGLRFSDGTTQSTAGAGLSDIVNDTTPQLGGDLDAQTYKITFTDGNVAIGDTDTDINTSYLGNIIVGSRAGSTLLGNYNIGIGYQSLMDAAGNNDTFNIGIGQNTLQGVDGNYNIGIGYQAAYSAGGFYGGAQRRAQKNICIGYQAGYEVLGDNNIEISPYNAGSSPLGATNASDRLNIGHTIFADMANRRVNIGVIGTTSSWTVQSDAALYVRSEATTDISVLVKARTSQSASLQEWQDNVGGKLLAVGPDGGLELPSNTPSTTTNKLYNDGTTLKYDGAVVPQSDPVAGASGVHNMMIISEATYTALGTKDPNTIYFIV
jgi:hypothetical protein